MHIDDLNIKLSAKNVNKRRYRDLHGPLRSRAGKVRCINEFESSLNSLSSMNGCCLCLCLLCLCLWSSLGPSLPLPYYFLSGLMSNLCTIFSFLSSYLLSIFIVSYVVSNYLRPFLSLSLLTSGCKKLFFPFLLDFHRR